MTTAPNSPPAPAGAGDPTAPGFDGDAIVYCDGAFGTTNGKTAHGLVRRTERYRVLSVIDARHAGADAGAVLDGRPNGIPVVADLESAIARAAAAGTPATVFVVGLAPDGGRLPDDGRSAALAALRRGLHVVAGLHDFLGDDPELCAAAAAAGVTIHDIRRPPERSALHFFSGRIEHVGGLRVALLGSDSAIGKRTTAWLLVDALERAGWRTELIGTGQTAWLQGARYGFILDSVVNDFVAGEIEDAIARAWAERRPDVMVLEGQGSLMNPAYPGGFELLAAGRPHCVVFQHAPGRRDYDGFPGYPIQPLAHQIHAVEVISERPVVAIAVNHEGLSPAEARAAAAAITAETGLPAVDPLLDGADPLVGALDRFLASARAGAER